MRLFAASVLAVVLGAWACDSSSATDTPEPWQFEVNLAPCGFVEPAVATVDIKAEFDLFHPRPTTRIFGKVLDAPPDVVHAVTMTEGACRYRQPLFAPCDPKCAIGEYCNAEANCTPHPRTLSAGTLSVQGLGTRLEITAESYSPGSYVGPTDMPPSALGPTAEIGARFSGAGFPSVTLGARGVAPMDDSLTATGLVLTNGADVEVTWTPGPNPEACVALVINGRNPYHGAPLQDIIECEGKDTGRLVIPQALVEAFPVGDTPEITNNYDWPFSTLSRYTRSRVDTARGPADLVVRSTTAFLVNHPE